MGLGKILLSFFCLFLIFGFFFMRGAILELKEKTEDLKTAEEQIKATMKEWKDSFRKETAVPTQATPESSPVGNTTKPDPLTEEENFSCVLRTWDGKIGIFTPDGYLMRSLGWAE